MEHIGNKMFQKHTYCIRCYLSTKTLVSRAEGIAVYMR